MAVGRLHTTTFRNGTLGQSGIKIVESTLNRGPFPTSRGNAIVNVTGYNIRSSFEVIDVPSMRMIVDLSDFDKSLVVHTTGQSGHPYHPHYIDQAELRFPRQGWTGPLPVTLACGNCIASTAVKPGQQLKFF